MTEKAKQLGRTPVHSFTYEKEGMFIEFGLTKRELFAAMAMQAILNNPTDWYDDYGLKETDKRFNAEILAIEYADALLEELTKTE